MGGTHLALCIITLVFILDSAECYVVDGRTTTVPEEATEPENPDIVFQTVNHTKMADEVETTTEIVDGGLKLEADSTVLQTDVLRELEAIWDYTESLTDPDLKSSLRSIVHWTHARVQSEPEELLDRLKYLLAKLRTRLNEAENSPEENKRKRSLRNGFAEHVASFSNLLEQKFKISMEEEQILEKEVPSSNISQISN